MPRVKKLMIALALAVGPLIAQAQITYNVDFTASPSEEVVGSITLAGNSLGQISADEITAWSLSSVPGDPALFSIKSKDAGAAVICGTQCGLFASADTLTFAPTAIDFTGIDFLTNKASAYLIGPYGGPACNSCLYLTVNPNQPLTYDLPLGTQIAKAPEIDPASAVSGLTLLLGGLAVLLGRRTKTPAAVTG